MSSSMWYIMQSIQSKYSLSERLIRTIAAIRSFPHDNVEDLIRGGADVNCTHGTLKPLHCACMVSDADCVELLLEKGAELSHWLEEQSPLTHPQNTARVWSIGEDPPCNKGWSISFYTGEPASTEGTRSLTPPTITSPYLPLGQALETIMDNEHSVALDKSNPHSGANSSIHACSRSPHIHHSHCVRTTLYRRKQGKKEDRNPVWEQGGGQ
uniref:Ankyrin repeat and SOCS box containing 8 n=1 Tax=Papio anubis TaxID=9555 RepID=A0A8I5NA86_PAPAN